MEIPANYAQINQGIQCAQQAVPDLRFAPAVDAKR